jgi:hypothetical protein
MFPLLHGEGLIVFSGCRSLSLMYLTCRFRDDGSDFSGAVQGSIQSRCRDVRACLVAITCIWKDKPSHLIDAWHPVINEMDQLVSMVTPLCTDR